MIRLAVLKDLIWPTLERSPEETAAEEKKQVNQLSKIEARLKGLDATVDELKEYVDASRKFLEDEQSRKASIESRLQTSAGMVSVVAAVALGPLLTFAVSKPAPLPSGVLQLIVVGCMYLAVQLIAVLKAALDGLGAASYLAELPHEVLPPGHGSQAVFLRARIRATLNRAEDDHRQNSKKLAQLKLAHCATRNFLGGLLLFVVLATAVALWKGGGDDGLCPAGMSCTSPTLSAGASSPGRSPAIVSSGAALVANPPAPSGTAIPPGTPVSAATVPPRASEIGAALVRAAIALGVCLCSVPAGIALVFAGGSTRTRIVGASMGLIGLISGFTVFGKLEITGLKLDKLIGELSINGGSGTVSPVPAQLATLQTTLHRAATIGPFRDGEHTLEGSRVGTCVTAALSKYRDLVIGGWVFVGRVDKRELTRERAGVYGSNQALAMARAGWVAQQTAVADPSRDLSSAIVTVGGAQRIGPNLTLDDLKADRAVDLFVMVGSSGRDAKSAVLPTAVICPSESISLLLPRK